MFMFMLLMDMLELDSCRGGVDDVNIAADVNAAAIV
jgi:hypothetical protein